MRTGKSGLPKHCSWNKDRHGKERVRFRKGAYSIYLKGIPWGEPFMRAWAAAMEAAEARNLNIGAERSPLGSLSWLTATYLDSPIFKVSRPETRRTRRNILERFRDQYGDLLLFSGGRMLLTRRHVQTMVNQKSATPFAQRNFLNSLRAMFAWAVSEGSLPDDPTLGVTRPKAKTQGYPTWCEEQIARYEAYHPIGSKARLAFALLLYTGQRRGDVIRMGPQMIQDGELVFAQEKTGKELVIPIHPALREIIDATPMVGVKTFLVTRYGKPHTAPGFGNWFRARCDDAGCHDVSAHGLRKAAATRLADLGCSDKQIGAIIGHASSIYTRAADQKRLAREAMQKLIEGGK
jgi:integrase